MTRDKAAVGFTFLELVVVMLIMAVAMALAAPRLGPQMASSRLRSAQAVLAGMAGMARYRAAELGRPLTMLLHPGASGLELVDPATSEVLISRRLGEAVRLRFARISGTTGREKSSAVVFSPDGSASQAELCLEGENKDTLTVTVEAATGRVREGA
jgi:type II secretion system protein H